MRILFQGDSITDAGRSRENNDCLGAGYPHLLKAALGFEEPGKYEFFNRGISSNRVVDLYTRIKAEPISAMSFRGACLHIALWRTSLRAKSRRALLEW